MDYTNKIDPLLLLSFDATGKELTYSSALSFGSTTAFDIFQSWEIIFTYIGEFEAIKQAHPQMVFENLINGYAIASGSKEDIYQLSLDDSIIYIEKPKRFFYETYLSRQNACINRAQLRYPGALNGRGTLVGIIDSGIDYAHPDFLNPDGTTRILLLWDQVLGEVYSSEIINQALSAPVDLRYEICPSIDLSGHGTHVAGIAAGNGAASDGIYRGIAYEANLIVVKLGLFGGNGFPGTVQLLSAVTFCIKQSQKLLMPLALNISFGNTYGSHSGTSLLENFFTQIATQNRLSICVGSGNEGASSGHTSGLLDASSSAPYSIELAIGSYSTSLSLQIWKRYEDLFDIQISDPTKQHTVFILENSTPTRYPMSNTILYTYYGSPAPYNIYQEIFIEFLPNSTYLDAGIWTITLLPRRIVDGRFDLWLPSSAILNPATRFLLPTPDTTLTIPSTSPGVITVGAYDVKTDTMAAFSGRGFTFATNQPKPDLVAPGVDITSCAVGGGYTTRSGTSMATPFVTGSCACLMQWGILEKNDPFLYGERMKAVLRRSTRALPGMQKHPNPQSGWGALCLDSIFSL